MNLGMFIETVTGALLNWGGDIKKTLEQHSDQLRRLGRVMSGKTTAMDGNYGVDMTSDYFL